MVKIGIGPVVLIIIGLLFLLANTGLVEHAFSRYWPVVLIAIGGLMLYNNWHHPKSR